MNLPLWHCLHTSSPLLYVLRCSDLHFQELLGDESVNLEAWAAGKEFGDLRFDIGSRVECRIGDDPITGKVWG